MKLKLRDDVKTSIYIKLIKSHFTYRFREKRERKRTREGEWEGVPGNRKVTQTYVIPASFG